MGQTRNGSPAIQPGYRTGKAPGNKGHTYPAQILTDAELQAILGACSTRGGAGIRNRALIEFMAETGARVSEALDLLPGQLDVTQHRAQILNGKGGKRRTVAFPESLRPTLLRWTDYRRRHMVRRRAPVFCTLKGEPLKAPYLRAALKRLAAKAGVEQRVHPHGLRHYMAVRWMQAGVMLPAIQAQLGHGSLATTETYLRGIAPSALEADARLKVWGESPILPPEQGRNNDPKQVAPPQPDEQTDLVEYLESVRKFAQMAAERLAE